MKKNDQKWVVGLLVAALLFVFAGCGKEAVDPPQPTDVAPPSESQAPIDSDAAASAEPTVEPEQFTAADGTFAITLPTAGNWKVEGDVTGQTSFVSEEIGSMDVMRLTGDDAADTMIPQTQEEFENSLREDPSYAGVRVLRFAAGAAKGSEQSYQVVMEYPAGEAFQYGVTYVFSAADSVYVLNALLKTGADEALEGVEGSFDSFTIQ